MSRSADRENNPCTRWFEWKGGTGKLSYYDKQKGERVEVNLPFTFLVLDQLSTITGWSDAHGCGIWANEVRNIQLEELVVRTKVGIAGTGVYEKVKAIPGAQYTKSIYIAFYDEQKKLQIGNLKASGACLSAWIEYCKGKDVYKGAVTLESAVSAKKGANKYYVPNFVAKPAVSEETEAAARELDRVLQDYLAKYFHPSPTAGDWQPLVEEEQVEVTPFASKAIDDDYIPF